MHLLDGWKVRISIFRHLFLTHYQLQHYLHFTQQLFCFKNKASKPVQAVTFHCKTIFLFVWGTNYFLYTLMQDVNSFNHSCPCLHIFIVVCISIAAASTNDAGFFNWTMDYFSKGGNILSGPVPHTCSVVYERFLSHSVAIAFGTRPKSCSSCT